MKINLQKICAIVLAVAAFCIISGCATANKPYSLKQTRDAVSFAKNHFHNEVSFGHIAPSFQPEVNTAYQNYKTAFDAAVKQANSTYDTPAPDNVKQLADKLFSILGSIPVVP